MSRPRTAALPSAPATYLASMVASYVQANPNRQLWTVTVLEFAAWLQRRKLALIVAPE